MVQPLGFPTALHASDRSQAQPGALEGSPVPLSTAWQSEFYSLLGSDVPDDVDKAYTLKEANLPPTVFKFRAADPRALENLKDGLVWLSSAARFNDPYDSSLSIDLESRLHETFRENLRDDPPHELDAAELAWVLGAGNPVEALTGVLRRKGTTDLTADEASALHTEVAKNAGQLTQAVGAELAALHQDAIQACAFTTEFKSLVMWAHYADCHRGFCVAYATAAMGARLRRQLYPVTYSKERFSVAEHFSRFAASTEAFDPTAPSAQHLPVLAAVHKAIDWEYEREWRLICADETGRSGVPVTIGKPSAVYLGARMPAGFRQELLRLAAEIPCYEMRLSPTTFALEPARL